MKALRIILIPSIIIILLSSLFTFNASSESNLVLPPNTSMNDFQINDEYNNQNYRLYPTDHNVGDVDEFWVTDLTNDLNAGFVLINATLLVEGNHCYIYMAEDSIDYLNEENALDRAERLQFEFDTKIYDSNLEYIGNPDGILGDIDGDPKLTILMLPLVRTTGNLGVTGYYHEKDDHPGYSYSNQREMVYVDAEISITEIIKVTAHEFSHLIYGNNEIDEARFIDEGIANYAVYRIGYYNNMSYWDYEPGINLTNTVPAFMSLYYRSLLYWHFHDATLRNAEYGRAYMFMLYLAERFGSEIVTRLVTEPIDGAPAMNKVLDDLGYDLRFNDIFLDWITACVLDNTEYEYGIYGYSTAEFKINTFYPVTSYPATLINKRHYYYGFQITKLYSPPDNFTIAISKPNSYSLGLSIAIQDTLGLRVIQKLYEQPSEDIYEFITGQEISTVYLITSLMSHNTPTTYTTIQDYTQLNFIEPNVDLNITILEGHQTSTETDQANNNLFHLIIPSLVLIQIIKRNIRAIKIKRKKE
ncbi:MAG: M1 family metallopeptidase [Asgard group archaeon]|nr:M1 family metallopeptidase [Asgard group archaeon]